MTNSTVFISTLPVDSIFTHVLTHIWIRINIGRPVDYITLQALLSYSKYSCHKDIREKGSLNYGYRSHYTLRKLLL